MRLAKAPANRTGAFASGFSPAPGYAAAARRAAAAYPGGAEPGPRPFPPSFRLPGPIGRGAWLSAAFWRWWNLQPPRGGGGGRARSAQKGWSRRPAAACSSLLFGRPGGPAGPRAAKRRRPPRAVGVLPAPYTDAFFTRFEPIMQHRIRLCDLQSQLHHLGKGGLPLLGGAFLPGDQAVRNGADGQGVLAGPGGVHV